MSRHLSAADASKHMGAKRQIDHEILSDEMSVLKENVKGGLARLGVLDFCIFLWEDQIRRFSRSRLMRNLQYRVAGAPDGLPIPPGYLIWLVVGTSDIQAFLESGAIHAQELICRTLQSSGLSMERFDAVLDFGCGCGRIMRYWKDLEHTQLHGADYNDRLVRWCKRRLPFAQFQTNQLEPPLDFQDGQFDFIYARSVFTHLAEDLQLAWLSELHRVLRPGGYLMLTVSGDHFLDLLTSAERERYLAGHLVVRAEEVQGKNYCAVYHPHSYVRREMTGERFDVVEFVPGDAARPYCVQDTYLLRSC